jgi:2,5-diketo-D-gluconate reductase A
MNIRSTVTLNTGRKMPVIGLGTWKLTKDTAGTIEQALQFGYPMIDTSGDYGTQKGISEGIKRSGISRDSFYLVTKVEENEDSYRSVKKNLEELGLEYADLILIHRPPQYGIGEQLWEGLIRAREEGLTKDIGVSNYSIDLIEDLIEETGIVPAVNQIEWTPFGHSDEMLFYCMSRKIIIQAYSPITRAERLKNPLLVKLANKYDKTPAQLLLRWNLQLGTIPLPKANQRTHLEENLEIFDFTLEEDDMHVLSSLNEKYSALGSLPYV